jgi:NAD(P)-dependent dehydrogenase (short-subunit alcohol dehydrogenase family)
LSGISSPVGNDILTFYVLPQEYLMMTEQQIVIIGGSEGIGLAVAKAARTLGARVLAVLRTRAKLEAGRDAVSGLEIRVADINNTASIQELFSELSTVDHVYIAAGSTKIGGPLDHPLSDFRHKFDERLWGSIDVVRAAHRLMRPGGSFTFTGGLSDRPVRGQWVSGIATMATEQLARVLALELAPIRFNAVAPGPTDTPMWNHILPENGAQVLSDVTKKYLIPRLVTAHEVAQAVLLLMQNEAITGETIHVDCGARLV